MGVSYLGPNPVFGVVGVDGQSHIVPTSVFNRVWTFGVCIEFLDYCGVELSVFLLCGGLGAMGFGGELVSGGLTFGELGWVVV